MNLTAFNKLGVRAKRIRIAKDVLERLKLGKFVQLHNWYSQVSDYNYAFHSNKPAKEFIAERTCEVCAKGSLVMSWVAQFNNKKMYQVLNVSGIVELDDFFGANLRNALEAAFEAFELKHGGMVLRTNWYVSRKTRERVKVQQWTLKRVMQNIIRNKGVFVYRGYKFGVIDKFGHDNVVKI